MADLKARLHLRDLDPDVPVPELAFFVLGKDEEVLETFDVDDEGVFHLDEGVLDEARRVVLAPREAAGDEPAKLSADQRLDFRPDEIRQRIVDARLELPPKWWCNLIKVRICVDGRVEHCRPTPWWWLDLQERVVPRVRPELRFDTVRRPAALRPTTALGDLDLRFDRPGVVGGFFGRRCEPVCEGSIEVFQRTCCCRPWILHDPRIPQLLDRLRELVEVEPPVPPVPPVLRGTELVPLKALEESPLFEGGTLSELAVNARRDLTALEQLEPQARVEYINARRYLFCWLPCGSPVRRGEGVLRTDGTFEVCWREPLRILGPFCKRQVAFKVRQLIAGQTVVIYDGLAAGEWFDSGDEIVLTSHHPDALSCPTPTTNPGEGEDAFVYLELVGSSQAHRIALPRPTGPTSVDLATPHGRTNPTNAGLLDPAPTPADAVGQYRNRNWGGGLDLFVRFSENLEGHAKYYRLSVLEATAGGVGTGTPTVLSAPRSWLHVFPVGGGQLDTDTVALGPFSQGGESNLYEIPYPPATGWWAAGQYHGTVDVGDFGVGGHLIVLELFDQNGAPVAPGPLPGGGGGNLYFKIWRSDDDAATPAQKFLDVPQPQLAHYFWFDDRGSVAQIKGLSLQGVASDEECQFLEGPGTDQVRVLYRAYHPDERFQLYHTLTWKRGISGGSGSFFPSAPPPFVAPNRRTGNVAQADATGAPSPPLTVAHLLDGHGSCSFALALHTHVKTTNGSGTLNHLEGHDTGAFALTNTTHTS